MNIFVVKNEFRSLKKNCMNVIAYIIYLAITYLVTFHVGMIFYKSGRVYILNLLKGNVSLTDSINKILLTGYYLLNLGYAALMISTWQTVATITALVESIFVMLGRILLTLAVIHYFNMLGIKIISDKKNIIHH